MNRLGRAGWRGYVAISLVWLAVLAGVLLFSRRPAAQSIEILPPPTAALTATPLPADTPLPTVTPRPLRVDVIGAVANPHVCTLPPGSIVADAISAAGGPAADADLERVNKAVELQDGMQVYVPHRGETPSSPALSTAPLGIKSTSQPAPNPTSPPARAGPAVMITGFINLNTATMAELETLPGVGPKTAQLIVEGRPYGEVDDLLKVKGIGPVTLAKVKDFVTVR